jgi:hypothetical protein
MSEGAMESNKVPPFCEFKSNTSINVTGAPGATDNPVIPPKIAWFPVREAAVARAAGPEPL